MSARYRSVVAPPPNPSISKIVRRVGSYGLPHCLRITVGTPAENDALVAALNKIC